MPETDLALVERSVAGDQAAFAELMQRHEDKIFSLALKMTGNRPDALDATQDTFIAAYRQISRFRGDAAFSTWIYRIGINACKDLLRRRSRLPDSAEEDELAAALPDARQRVDEGVALRMDLAAALRSLPDDYREAVCLHDIGGTPYEEIALLTGVAVGTVKSRISRGRRRLAALLEHPARAASSKEEP